MFRNRIIMQNLITIIIVIIIINVSLADEFVYPPLNRSSTEWKNLTPIQKHQICQIPDEVIATIPTDQLIKTLLDYPFIGIIWAYDNWMDGFNRVYKDFNGLRELLNRKDAAKMVLKYYSDLDPGAYEGSWPDKEQGAFSIKFMYIEMILSQESIQNQLQSQEIEELIRVGVIKYDQKMIHLQVHGKVGLEFTVLPIGKAIKLTNKDAYEDLLTIEGMEYFISTGHRMNEDIIINIIQEARNY